MPTKKEIQGTETFQSVLKHRATCPYWKKGYCLDCFGGGLEVFAANLIGETDLERRAVHGFLSENLEKNNAYFREKAAEREAKRRENAPKPGEEIKA